MNERKEPRPPDEWRLEPDDRQPAPGTPSPPIGPRRVVVRSRREPIARPRRTGRKVLVIFLLVNIIPAAAAVWWFTQTEGTRKQFLSSIPDGVATRAGIAGIAFALLIVLAKVVLPGARATGVALVRAQAWFRRRKPVVRVLLFPAELFVGLLWFLSQCLFAIDAIAILACAGAFLLYIVRIFKPEMFDWLPG